MSQKEFGRTLNGYVFMSDERDIGVSWSKRQEVHDWAGTNGITIEYQGTLGGIDVWRVRNDQQRAWFNLRWS
jgi:hypothetical protein